MQPIYTLAELLNSISHKENEKLKELNITHPTTIGCMYEGLTAELLNKVLFKGLNLQVSKNSFIEGCQKEFDILLTDGSGKQIPHTERYIFKPEQVLVIIQVKKNLFRNDVGDSYENLMGIPDIYRNIDTEDYMARMATTSIRQTLRKQCNLYKEKKLSTEETFIGDCLVRESKYPIRIVIGYNGIKSEESLRTRFVEYLSENITTDKVKHSGYGPNNFPNLIICDNNSLIKLLGTPFNSPIQKEDNGWWNLVGSSHYNPMYFFVEAVWSKLSYKYELSPVIFGEDLNTPMPSPYLAARIKETSSGAFGWEYNYIGLTSKELNVNEGTVEWKPAELDMDQYSVMSIICSEGYFEMDEKLAEDLKGTKYNNVEDFAQSLVNTGLVAWEGNRLMALVPGITVTMIGDKFLAGENRTGRFDNWLMKHSFELLFGNKH